jgi:flagellar motility protein MotE (MotC chaperone)
VLDYLDVIELRRNVYPVLGRLPGVGGFFEPRRVTWERMKEEELRKIRASIKLQLDELKEQEEILSRKREELRKKEGEILERRRSLMEEERKLNERMRQYESEERKIQKLAAYYEGMSPREAALILQELDDLTVIDILRAMKDETVSIIMMNMAPRRAAEITRKMSR